MNWEANVKNIHRLTRNNITRNLCLVLGVVCFFLAAAPAAQTMSTGTGFVIAPDGYIATCYHVIDGFSDLAVRDNVGRVHSAALVLTDVTNDLAVMKIDVLNFPFLPIRGSSKARKGDEVFTIGYPNITMQGTDAKVTQGIISSLAGLRGEPNSFQISVAVQPGNSGGPLFDSSGAVIGIVSAKLSQKAALQKSGMLPENVNYALKSNYLLELLATAPYVLKNAVGLPRKPSTESRSSVVARVEGAAVLIVATQMQPKAPQAAPPAATAPPKQEQPRGQAPGEMRGNIPGGSSCEASWQCAGNLVCVGAPRLCLPLVGVDHPCMLDNECVQGLYCGGNPRLCRKP